MPIENNRLQRICKFIVLHRVRICKPLKEPSNRFQARRANTTSLFVVLARQPTYAGGIDSSESISGLLKRLQIRALVTVQTVSYITGFGMAVCEVSSSAPGLYARAAK